MKKTKGPASINRSCERCGAAFTVPYPSTRKKRCTACRTLDRRTRSDKGTRKSEAWIVVQCAQCGADFKRPRGYVARRERDGYRLFCSYACRDAAAVGSAGRPPREVPARWIDNCGYVRVYVAPEDRPVGWRKSSMLEHRVVMSRMIGRPLLPIETVHHINGDKTDNRPASR